MNADHTDINNKFKKDDKVIDAINYNGKYIDARVLKDRIISITAVLTALIAISLALLFLC